MARSQALWRRVALLAGAGGLAFWLANLAISLTPLAAQYREALSIDYVPMLLEALAGGLAIGVFVSFFLVRFIDRIPSSTPMVKSLLLSGVALVVVTLVVEVPAKFATATSNAWWYFLIATLFNAVRILALAVAIGLLYGRLEQPSRT